VYQNEEFSIQAESQKTKTVMMLFATTITLVACRGASPSVDTAFKEAMSGGQLGGSVSLSETGNVAVAGSAFAFAKAGSATVWERNDAGSEWIRAATLSVSPISPPPCTHTFYAYNLLCISHYQHASAHSISTNNTHDDFISTSLI
jgi:hypothetical protein